MPFEYTPYRSPFTGAIADLIGRQGDIAAERAMADARARTATVGAITNSLANIAQYRADAPKRELQQMQLAEARQKMADTAEARTAGNTFASMITDPNKGQFQPEGPDLTTPTGVVPAQDGFTTSIDGVELFDKAKVAQRMAQMGHGAWMMEHGDKVDELNKSLLEMDAFEKKSLQNAAMTWAALPEELQLTGASQILKVMGKRLSPEQVSVLQQQIDSGDVAGLKAAITPLLPKPDIAVANTPAGGVSTFYDKNTGQVVGTVTGPDRAKTATELAQEVSEARLAVSNNTATPAQQDLVKRDDLRIAANRAPRSVTPESAFLDTYATEHGAENFASAPGALQAQALEAWRNSSTRPPQPESDVSTYNGISSKIETIAKPVTERIERLGRIVDTLDSGTAVADSLVAPELLSAMAAGAGSGIRINEAEIKRVLGAQSKVNEFKSALMKVSTGNTVPDDMRQQMYQLVRVVKGKVDKKTAVINEARQKLARENSIEGMRLVFADMNEQLSRIDGSSGVESGNANTPSVLPSLGAKPPNKFRKKS